MTPHLPPNAPELLEGVELVEIPGCPIEVSIEATLRRHPLGAHPALQSVVRKWLGQRQILRACQAETADVRRALFPSRRFGSSFPSP